MLKEARLPCLTLAGYFSTPKGHLDTPHELDEKGMEFRADAANLSAQYSSLTAHLSDVLRSSGQQGTRGA